MKARKDLEGQVFNRWTFGALHSIDYGGAVYHVRCACGFQAIRRATTIVTGRSKGCTECAAVEARRKAAADREAAYQRMARFAP